MCNLSCVLHAEEQENYDSFTCAPQNTYFENKSIVVRGVRGL